MTYTLEQSLVEAVLCGNIEAVERLIPMCSKEENSRALLKAAENGKLECLQLLLPVSGPMIDEGEPLRVAAREGHTQCVEALLSVVDPMVDGSIALRTAAKHDHTDCVRLLIQVSNPLDCNSEALVWGILNRNQEIVELLYSVSDPQAALNCMLSHPHHRRWFGQLEERIERERQRETLEAAVGEHHHNQTVRKI